MALGNYDNNKKNQINVNVYSSYKMSNTEGIDPSAINFTFCLNMLKISISPKKPGDQIAFDHEKAIECFLTHTKAKMLSDEIKNMLKQPKGEIPSVSVSTGKDGLITFTDGRELGTNKYTLLLRKTDENGVPVSTYAYEFKTDYHFVIRNYDPEKPSAYDKVFHDNIEIDQFLILLDQYIKAATGAMAYFTLENSKYGQSRVNTKLDSIMEKLGIEIPNKGNYSRGTGGSSFFTNSQNTGNTYRQGSLDDFSSVMNPPEED